MKKFIISSAAIAMAMAMTANAVAAEGDSKYFKDVTVNNYGWAVEYVDYIAKNGIASGIGADMYAPGSNIERGDFAILVDKTFTFRPAKIITYALKDVPEDSYYAQAIANCCGADVITERGMYYPEKDITRIDAIVMLYRALTNNNLLSGGLSTDTSMFVDGSVLTTAERQVSVGTLYKLGIINGDDKGNLNPDSTMTRAEMAVVFTKLDKYIDEYKVDAAKKAEEKAEADKIKAAEEEQNKKEEAKADESRNYSNEEVKDTISASNGGSISVENCNVSVTSDNGVSVDNESEAAISNSNISSLGGNGIDAKNKSTVKIKGGAASATNGNGINAASKSIVDIDGTKLKSDGKNARYAANVTDGAKLNIKNTEITAADNLGAISIANGGKLDLADVVINASNGTGKGTYAGAIDIKSTNADESEINLENTVINNKKGAAFYIRESDVTINIKGGSKINTAMLINSPDILKESQERGNNITLNLTDKADIQNTRIVLDNKTVLNINIDADCTLGGQIDTDMKGYINLDIDQEGTLILDNDLYLDGFKDGSNLDFDNILDNGFNIYYNENNPENDWLLAKTYDLLLGGKLIPYSKQAMER